MKKISLLLPLAAAGLALAAGSGRADNIFVTSNGSNSVEEISDNQVTQFVNQSSDLFGPTGIAINSSGDIFVANNGTAPGAGFIAEFSPTGQYLGNYATGLWNPRGLVFDSAGDLFVANQSSASISEIVAGGSSAVTVATGVLTPNGITVDAQGNLYVANGGGAGTVDKISFSGGSSTVTTFADGLTNPNGVIVISSGALSGDIAVVDQGSSQVLVYDASGNLLPGNPLVSDPDPADGPKYIAVDTAGDFYVTDADDGKVTEYGPDGNIIEVYTTDVNGNNAFIGACGIVAESLVVPEPTTDALLLGSLAMLFLLMRRKRARALAVVA